MGKAQTRALLHALCIAIRLAYKVCMFSIIRKQVSAATYLLKSDRVISELNLLPPIIVIIFLLIIKHAPSAPHPAEGRLAPSERERRRGDGSSKDTRRGRRAKRREVRDDLARGRVSDRRRRR